MVLDIITIGSATIDTFAYTDASEVIKIKDSKSEQDFIAYTAGDKIVINDLTFQIGGGGTNTAVSFSRLGLKTAYLGKLGSDENANKVLELLKKENIQFIGSQEGKTGYSIVLDSFEHERTILTYKGSNNNLLDSDVVLSNLQSKWLYASSMIGKSFETLKSIINIIKKTGSKVAFNPSSYQAERGLKELSPILKNLDVLVLNKEEAQQVLNHNEFDCRELAKKLSREGPSYVVITDGKKGAHLYHEGKIYTIGTSKEVKVIETTGAGDAFASGFVAGLFYEMSPEDSLKLGLIQSEASISALGAKTNLLFKHDAIEKINSLNVEVKVLQESGEETNILSKHCAPQGKEFVLKNDRLIKNLHQFSEELKEMPEEVFNHHTNEKNHHFSNWIKDVFNKEDLAQRIKTIKSKNEMSDIIKEHLRGETQ